MSGSSETEFTGKRAIGNPQSPNRNQCPVSGSGRRQYLGSFRIVTFPEPLPPRFRHTGLQLHFLANFLKVPTGQQ